MDNETKQKKLTQMYQLYYEKDKEFEAAKLKRSIITIFGYAVAIFLILCYSEKPSGWDIAGDFMAALFLSGVLFLINTLVFTYLIRKSDTEGECLKALKNSIGELTNEQNL